MSELARCTGSPVVRARRFSGNFEGECGRRASLQPIVGVPRFGIVAEEPEPLADDSPLNSMIEEVRSKKLLHATQSLDRNQQQQQHVAVGGGQQQRDVEVGQFQRDGSSSGSSGSEGGGTGKAERKRVGVRCIGDQPRPDILQLVKFDTESSGYYSQRTGREPNTDLLTGNLDWQNKKFMAVA